LQQTFYWNPRFATIVKIRKSDWWGFNTNRFSPFFGLQTIGIRKGAIA